MAAMRFVRVRIRSWKDVVLIFVVGGVIVGLQYVLEHKLGMEERPARIISVIAGFIVAIIWLFATDDD